MDEIRARHFINSLRDKSKRTPVTVSRKAAQEIADILQEALEERKPTGTFECFHCGQRQVVWGSDFSFSDFGLDGEGIVHELTCQNCGAEIEYYVSSDQEEQEDPGPPLEEWTRGEIPRFNPEP